MQMIQLLALALSVASVDAASKGFNYGATKADGSSKYQADFQKDFAAAKALVGQSGFTSARLYTMIQGGTTNTPIEAIPAAIAEKTELLLGLWVSGGNMENEITALKAAISQYGEDFAKLVVGISVGSEDMYRNSVTGSKSNAGPGVEPEELVSYIKEVRSTIAGTGLSDVTLGHVDTWDSWTNSSNSDVVNHLDWLGFDGYPYYQLTMENGIENAKALFDDSVEKTKSVANGKEVWITETGWPEGDATASAENAQKYWDEVGCPLFGNTNTWWYMLEDEGASPSFGVVKSDLSTPQFDLSCNSTSSSTTSSSAAGSASTGLSNKGSTGSGSGSNSGSGASSSGASSSGASSSGSSSADSSSSSGASGSSGSGSGASSGSASTPAVSSKPTSVPGRSGSHSSSFASASRTSTPLASATGSGSSSSGSSSGSGSGSGTSSSGSGSSSSGSSSGSAASVSSTFNAAARTGSGSTFGAIVAAAVLAIAV
ncbi:unnamed protein product [Penicillium pancosmium]